MSLKSTNSNLIIALFGLLLYFAAQTAYSQKLIHLSPIGNDKNAGSSVSPLKTLTGARNFVRKIKKSNGLPEKGIKLILHAGTYQMKEPLTLRPEDSGLPKKPIVWTSAGDGEVILSGGESVTGWTPFKNGIWKADLKRVGKLRQLYVNGVAATMTKYSKQIRLQGGYGEFKVNGDEPWALGAGTSPDGVLINSGDLPQLKHPEDLEFEQEKTWTMSRICVRGAKDVEIKGKKYYALLLEQPYSAIAGSLRWGSWKAKKTSDFYNAFEFLKNPGDFYYDRADSTIYYIPRNGEDMKTAEVIAPLNEELIQITGDTPQKHVSYITFSKISFKYTAWQLMTVAGSHGCAASQATAAAYKFITPKTNWHHWIYNNTDIPVAAVFANAADHINIIDNNLINLGGIGINFENDVQDSRIAGNLFKNIGISAINIGHPQHVYIGKQNGNNGGYGPYNIDNSNDKYDENHEALCRNIDISNNLIRHCCWGFPPSIPLNIFVAADVDIEHNDIADSPYTAISVGWGWWEWGGTGRFVKWATGKPQNQLQGIKVRYNRINKPIQKLHDGAAIYFLSELERPAEKQEKQKYADISGNYITGIVPNESRRCIMPDSGSKYLHFHNNLCNVEGTTVLVDSARWQTRGNWTTENNYITTDKLYFIRGGRRKKNPPLGEGIINKNNHIIPKDHSKWPEEALKIEKNSGLTPDYQHLINLLQKRDRGLQRGNEGK
jgi:hypothetical protein